MSTFIVVNSGLREESVRIIVDCETGVQYVKTRDGICPRIDASGRPMVMSSQEVNALESRLKPQTSFI